MEDTMYQHDPDALQRLENTHPWTSNPKFFDTCHVSALAATKMLKHSLSGVEQGRREERKPLEIMGLLLGRPTEHGGIVVTDCFPLPVEGTETRVVADDPKVAEYMVQLATQLELERLIGWYHSHPFDVATESNAFLSFVDIQTQLAFQMQFPYWVAVVVDPLRSLAKQCPDFGVFRAFPPSYTPANENECPDGKVIDDSNARQIRWGLGYNRYYAMKCKYFISSVGNSMLETMSRSFLWIRVLGSSAVLEPDNRSQLVDRLNNLAGKLEQVDIRRGLDGGDPLENISREAVDIGIEQADGASSQILKNSLFNDFEGLHLSNDSMHVD